MSLFILFISAFGAATILPFYSEIMFVSLLDGKHSAGLIWIVATTGNTLGAAVNWALGRFFMRFQSRAWFPFTSSKLTRAEKWFKRYGKWSLLMAWMPLCGDALTFIAGSLRLNFWVFLPITAVGKGLRYAFVALVYFGLFD